MADQPLGRGSTIYVQHFHQSEPIAVQIVSSVATGAGATARIYKGRAGPKGHKYDVALKVIPNLLDESRQKVLDQLIRREVEAISQLSNRAASGILPFLGTASAQFHMIIASKFMRNGNLLDYLKAVPDADPQSLVIQVAETVHWLHVSHNLVHGDLKCENILVNDTGDALLADFGLATLVEQESSSLTTITAIRQMNTLPFAAPELLFGSDADGAASNGDAESTRPRSKTCQSDVYAFGMLTLQAFTGVRPWGGLNEHQIYGAHFRGSVHPRPPDAAALRGLTDSWWAVCLKCWEKQPEERPEMKWVWETLESKRRTSRTLLAGPEFVSLVLSPCGKRVVSVDGDGTVRVLDMTSGQTIIGPLKCKGYLSTVNISSDSLQICAGVDNDVLRWDAESGAPIGQPLTGHSGEVCSVAYSPDSTRIVSGSDDCTVRLWDVSTGEALGVPLEGHTDPVWCVAFSPDGACIASGSEDSTIRLWDSATGAHLETLEGHEDSVYSLSFSPDRIHLVSGSADQTVRLWNVETRKLERTLRGHSNWVRSVAVSQSARYIASGSFDKTIRIWDAQTGEAVAAPLTGHTDWVRSVAFSPDGRSIVSGSGDESVRVWDLFE